MNSNNIPALIPPSSKNTVKEQTPVSFKTILANALFEQKPGDIIKGTIIDLNKDRLTISLSDETILHAILDASIPLNIGDSASFQVSGYKDSVLMLKLLSSHIPSTLDATVEKALSEAAIPKNEETKKLVLALLDENLPIDKNTLKLLYQQMRTYPDTPLKDLVLLMKLNLPATPASITQLGLYQNQEHQITKQFESLKDSLLDYITDNPQSTKTQEVLDTLNRIFSAKDDPKKAESFSAVLSDLLSSDSESDSDISGPLPTSTANTMLSENALSESEPFNPEFLNLFSKAWRKHFSLSADDLKKEGISSFYKRLHEDLQVLKDLLIQKADPKSENAAKQISTLSDNLEFIRNLNSTMLFAQIPFQLKEKNIHSELFVYTKKKQLKKNPDDISMLLHLDMDSLGPVDVHITMHVKNVQAKFYLREDSCLLVEKHLSAFSKHLQSKGYYLNYSIQEQKEIHCVMNEIKKSCDNPIAIKGSRYAFDLRA
ncbi:MAG: hypothetical protein E7256_10285 [Lachnospiraceae bacterium]|nr:hypothetical protein [Lachnospiraceae bacterium]